MHYGIVGGGMLGLTLALRLLQAGHRVSVVEAAPTLGGLAGSWRVGDVQWDRYYHVIAGADTALCGLLDELGLASRIVWKTTRTNFYDGRSLRPLNNALDYFALPALGMIDKLRLAITILKAARIEDGLALEQLGAEEWLTRLGGARNWRQLWRPLMRSKLGANCEHASAAYIWSVIRRFYGAREGHFKTERFGFVPGGYRSVVGALATRLEAQGAALHLGHPVVSVRRTASGGMAVESEGHTLACDQVVMTCAAPLVAQLCPQLDAVERQGLLGLRYQGIVCASLLLSRPLGGAYLTYITDEQVPFTTVIEMSTLVDRASLGGHHLVYLPRYVPVDDAAFERTDDELAAEFRAGLMAMFPSLQAQEILALRVTRSRHVLAIATRGYSAQIPPLRTSVAGLCIVNSAQIVNAALSVNDSVRLAETSLPLLLKS